MGPGTEMTTLDQMLGQSAVAWAVATVAAYLVLRDDTRRRCLLVPAHVMVAALAAGAFIATLLVGRWLGITAAVLGAIVAALLLARAYRLSSSLMLDVAATAIAAGVALARIAQWQYGSLVLAGIAGLAIYYWLWQEGHHSVQWQRPRGIVFAEFLILDGALRAVSGRVLASSLAVVAGIASIVAGAIVLALILPRFLRTREEHRIIEDVNTTGDSIQSEYAPSSPECPHPELWKMYDSMSAEVEVLDFLKQVVLTLKPNVIVETGTFMGISTLALAEGLKQNGFGRVITVEFDPRVFAKAKERFDASGLGSWIDARNQSSLELQVHGTIDLLFSDSAIGIRESEVRHFLPQVSPTGLILMHDASSHQKVVREAALRLESEGLISVVLLPTPRGLVIAQKRAARK